jgi:hypothetical protein
VSVRVASTAAVASVPSSPVSPMVGAPAVAASTARIAVRDDLPVTTGAVTTLGESTGCCRLRLGLAASSARVRLQPMSALRLVALLSRFLTGGA